MYYDNIFKNIYELINKNPYSNIVIFSSTCDKISTHNIPVLHLTQAKFFNGDLWMFDIMSLVISKNFPNLNRKLLYCNDIPWLQSRNTSYNEWKSLYAQNIDFITTNQYLYDIYSICWKIPLDIMESFDNEKIQHILQ